MNRLPGHFLLILLVLFYCWSLPVVAADRPNLLIVAGQMEHVAGFGHHSDGRMFARVSDALVNQLDDAGFDVFDAAAFDVFDAVAIRRGQSFGHQGFGSDAQIIAQARRIQRPPIDIVVLFSVNTTAQGKIRINGRLLSLQSGRRLGNFEVLGDRVRVLAADLGRVLQLKLSWLVDGEGGEEGEGGQVTDSSNSGLLKGLTLVFDHFSADEIMAIEEYLVLFSGYHHHRTIYQSMTRVEWWYQSRINIARLNRNMVKMLAQLALRGIVQFSGNTLRVQKITLRKRR